MSDFPLIRIGLGHDTHRLGEGGPMKLGGITIDCDFHLVGHSDADVLLHAITDAILGAACLGDIGTLFPDTVEENENRCSQEMLRLAHAKILEAGWKIINLDCVIFATQPKISPCRDTMIECIRKILGLNDGQVFVKGKTGEKVGPVGRCEAIVAECVALLHKVSVRN
ncbi:MAG: 2-C-methyl-D-erythritol 2,4-cyclodiphosphate synthase [Planctomycetaceae bacterium]|jgi:2-C-methyl-D-erythritol 2,4-cyclodiphosphate synthase|nr:2-C-methyl-D-erythritol 2,4-cyclodiphosphate synthase [Planctomycetaceae bacterium]